MPAAERDNNGRSAAAPAPRGHIWSRCSLPIKAGCAGNARCLGRSGTQPRSSRRHQPWARVLALQSWHGAGGRARAGSGCSPGLGQLSPAASPDIPWKGSSKHPRGLPGAPSATSATSASPERLARGPCSVPASEPRGATGRGRSQPAGIPSRDVPGQQERPRPHVHGPGVPASRAPGVSPQGVSLLQA